MTSRTHSRKTATPGTKGLALAAVAVGAALSLSACGTAAAPGPSPADQVALTALTNLTTHPAAATTGFTPAMTQIVPAAALAQDWTRYQQLLGTYQSHGQPQDLPQGTMTVVNLPLSMSHTPGQLRVTVDHDGHIAGLFFLNAGTPFTAHTTADPIHPAASIRPAKPAVAIRPAASSGSAAAGTHPTRLEKDTPGTHASTAAGNNSGHSATTPPRGLPITQG